MRIRTIKPEWLDDERLVLASPEARVLSIALILLADDHGNGRANRTILSARVFPGSRDPRETLANALDSLAAAGFVELYDVDGQAYFAIRNWAKHQKVDHPGKPQVPVKPKISESSRESRETLAKVPESLALDQDQEGTRKGPGVDAREASEVAPHVATFRAYVAAVEAKTGRHEAETPEKLKVAKGAHDELARTAANLNTTPEALLSTSVARWLADPFGKRVGWKFTEWAKQAAALAVAEPATARKQNVAPPSSHADFARIVAENGGEEKGYAEVGF